MRKGRTFGDREQAVAAFVASELGCEATRVVRVAAFATNAAISFASLNHLVTQVSWVKHTPRQPKKGAMAPKPTDDRPTRRQFLAVAAALPAAPAARPPADPHKGKALVAITLDTPEYIPPYLVAAILFGYLLYGLAVLSLVWSPVRFGRGWDLGRRGAGAGGNLHHRQLAHQRGVLGLDPRERGAGVELLAQPGREPHPYF